MSLPKNVVRVDPTGVPGDKLTVDVLDAAAGSSVVAYKDARGSERWTLPATVTGAGAAEFYVVEGNVWVSAKAGGQEVAAAGGVTAPVVFDASSDAKFLRPTMDADELVALAAANGGYVPDSADFVSLYAASSVDASAWTGWDALNDVSSSGFPAGWSVSGRHLIVPAGLYALSAGVDIQATTVPLTVALVVNLAPSGSAAPEATVPASTDFSAAAVSLTAWVSDVGTGFQMQINGPALGNAPAVSPWMYAVRIG